MWVDLPEKLMAFGTEKTMKDEICYIKPLKDTVNICLFGTDEKDMLNSSNRVIYNKFDYK